MAAGGHSEKFQMAISRQRNYTSLMTLFGDWKHFTRDGRLASRPTVRRGRKERAALEEYWRVASYGALRHEGSTSNCLFFCWSLQSLTNTDIGLYVVAYAEIIYRPIALSLTWVYCITFITFLCVTLKLVSLSFMPLLRSSHQILATPQYRSTSYSLLATFALAVGRESSKSTSRSGGSHSAAWSHRGRAGGE